MEEIEFSFMSHTDEPSQTIAVLESFFSEFTAQTRIKVNLRCLEWHTALSDLTKMAIARKGPDVSEIGSTWTSELIAMNALRPFALGELTKIGKPEEFAPASWATTRIAGDATTWSLPWHAETYVIHYRTDLLRQAGVDEATAFQTHAQIARTAQQLSASGVDVPIELPLSSDRYGTLHALASWIWGQGGDFLSHTNKQVGFDQPEALTALQDYFGSLTYLSAEGRRLMVEKKNSALFPRGLAAMAFGTIRLARSSETPPPQVVANWGIAALPQPCFVGGSNIAIWSHTRHERAALELVRFLTKATALARCHGPLATLPPRLSALVAPEIQSDPMYRVMAEAVRTGRSYPPIRLWGVLEDRLVGALAHIGEDLLAQPEAEIETTIRRHIKPLAQRLNMTLGQ